MPRFIAGLALFVIPGCLLVQPLDEAKEDDDEAGGSGGRNGTGGSSVTGGSGGKGGGSGGKGGSAGKGGAAGSGGSTTGGKGGAGASGMAGKGGTGGSAGSGNAGSAPLSYNPVWTFDDDLEGWALGYTEPTSLGLDATAAHDADDGEPDDGSVALTIPFDDSDQTVEFGVVLRAPLDLTGETIGARVRLDSGFFEEGAELPGAVKVYVKTGSELVYADGPWTRLTQGQWTIAPLSLSAPDYDAGIDETDVRELGVAFKTDPTADSGWTTGSFHLDTVGWVNAERPPCILDPLLIDDMETPDGFGWVCHTDGRSGGWYLFDDETMTATRTPAGQPVRFPLSELEPPRGKSMRAVRVTGEGYESWGGGVGTTMLAAPNETAVLSYDVSNYAGISFMARGSGTMWVQVSIREARDANMPYPGTCGPALAYNCNDNFASNTFTLTDTWTEYVVPFATMNQEGWGHPVPWTYNLNSVEFRWGTNETFDFWIDDLRFVERECDDDDPVECTDDGQRCHRGTRVATACDTECSGRGYTGATCSATGCQCDTPAQPAVLDGIDSMCACGMPNLDCSEEGRAVLERQATTNLQTTMLCYAMYPSPTAEDCTAALGACWPNE